MFHINFATAESLHAKRALFHNPTGPDGHVWVQLVAEAIRPVGLPVVKHSCAIWAVDRTISGADAAVVDLDVHTLIVVIGGEDRADRFAGSVFTMLT